MSRQRYLIKWTGKSDTAIFDDPRCNGDPSGTVKAYVRFFSPSLGRDTGPIPLPCDGWTVVPRADSPTGHRERFKYVDRRYVYGPCNQVVAENGRKLKVTCNGSMGYADFRYDLEAGTSEETVCAALRIGAGKFVTRFRGVASRDGSDGERFDGVWEPVPFDEPNACDLPESLP
jgi:hypothetical protein